MNSSIWSIKLNDTFIQGGIDIGETFYLWDQIIPHELELINKAGRDSEFSLDDLIKQEITTERLPVLMRSPASESTPAQPSVTAREIEQLLTSGYKLVYRKEKTVSQYEYSNQGKRRYHYKFVPTVSLRQSLSVENPIRSIGQFRNLD